MYSQFACTWHLHISALENIPSNTFRKNFPPKNCEAKLATVTNQPVTRPPTTSSGQKKVSLQPVESIDSCRCGLNF